MANRAQGLSMQTCQAEGVEELCCRKLAHKHTDKTSEVKYQGIIQKSSSPTLCLKYDLLTVVSSALNLLVYFLSNHLWVVVFTDLLILSLLGSLICAHLQALRLMLKQQRLCLLQGQKGSV